MIEPKHLPPGFGQVVPRAPVQEANAVRLGVGTTVDEAERLLILKTLEATNNNKTRAAEILGISLKTLHNKLKEYGSQAAKAPAKSPKPQVRLTLQQPDRISNGRASRRSTQVYFSGSQGRVKENWRCPCAGRSAKRRPRTVLPVGNQSESNSRVRKRLVSHPVRRAMRW